jgi:D-threo-aldose 1-dehydrogenase
MTDRGVGSVLGATTVRLGLGCGPLGNLYREYSDAEAAATVEAAWGTGVRFFDTAPHYGLGLSERRLGAALAGLPRADYAVSTKVGRLLVPDPAGVDRLDDQGFAVPGDLRRVWDFSADGVRRSLDGSLSRLGLDRVDILLLHDPEGHERVALDEGFPALVELRAQGVAGAIGVGSTDWRVLHRFVTEAEPDVVLVAGRYTLLEQPALETLLPACVEHGVAVLNAGVFNSGILAVDRPSAALPYEYGRAPADVVARAQAVAAVCDRHGVPLPQAALAFAAAHPAVVSVLVGAGTAEEMRRNAELFRAGPPPAALWRDLVDAGLLDAGAPLPAG